MNCHDCDYRYTILSGKDKMGYVCNCPDSEHRGDIVNDDTKCENINNKRG